MTAWRFPALGSYAPQDLPAPALLARTGKSVETDSPDPSLVAGPAFLCPPPRWSCTFVYRGRSCLLYWEALRDQPCKPV